MSAHGRDSHYDLYLRAGRSFGFYYRNLNHGVTLTADRIKWRFDGKDDSTVLEDIGAVHLQTGGDWRNPVATCLITFCDGYQLVIASANEYGIGDAERQPVYRDFVRDLHARLVAKQSSATFTCGFKGLGYPLIVACGVLLGLICVGVPVIAMIATQSVGPITMLLAGIGLYWPLTKAIEKNAPRNYDPRNPPEELLE